MRSDDPAHSPGNVPIPSWALTAPGSARPARKAPVTPAPKSRSRPSHRRHSIIAAPIKSSQAPAIPRLFQRHPSLPHSTKPPFQLSVKALDNLDNAFRHAWAPGTLNNYGYAVDRFLAFCAQEKIPIRFQLPADEFVLCAFAASGAGIHAGSTARNNIAALKAWHVAQGQTWKGSSRLHYVLAGVENLAPETSKRPPRPPINAEMLRVLYNGLDFTYPRDVAIFAAACVAFWGQCRLGEILPDSTTEPALMHKPTRAQLPSQQKSGEDVVLVAQNDPINPEIALHAHLKINNLPANLPLFAYRTGAGVEILTRAKFLLRCNQIWSKAGYPHTTGHSFRIGGTTELLLAGVAPDVVKALGRWSSDAFHRYWRSLEDLAPIHAAHINTPARHSAFPSALHPESGFAQPTSPNKLIQSVLVSAPFLCDS
ncbi:hypothetical protein C8R43DRAFT_1138992 [Mycena crocata]|nr:hypothetical protein C8R43DRAFT_1138992 [Mycena crocata]